ncbi:protoheme IX farnesyltransferase [Microbacterium protaetiae]|uniref:Protoheme IX farnesyltransferase n=1 Tax=Microbacterium protaetiae TaxID=2509458 RepID=A0A4P6EF80_9MICO|nr:heme o synthase [Microbacterium protaetiae]QAY60446.1 protoheme IX farnesyltransferase [Microbacterium protaetiae]
MSHTGTSPQLGRDAALAARAVRPGILSTITRYYSLTKPGVLYGNVLTTVAGYLLAAAWFGFSWRVFVGVVVGSTFVIASACVLNNVLDRDIDTLMQRTSTRATVTGAIGKTPATIFSIVLGVLGTLLLIVTTNWWVVGTGVGGFIVYVWFYGALSKRMSVHGTLVGSISGAAPILGGYLAASGRFDMAAVAVFLMVFFWQEPEFYSIAIYRRDEYARAGVPVISVVRGNRRTVWEILVYTVLFVASSMLLPLFGYVGITYTVVMGLLGLAWIVLGIAGLRARDVVAWSHQMFRGSMVMILALCVMVAIGPLLP